MARKGPKQFSGSGRVKKGYTGHAATRPIPVVEYEGDRRASLAAAGDQRPKTKAVNMPQGPRVGGVSSVFGSKISSGPGGNVFNPGSGLERTL